MTDQSQTATRFRSPLRSQDLSPGQRSLVELMHEHQFGRIENIAVQDGEPVLDRNVRVVQIARLGGQSARTSVVSTDDFELKRQVRDLFDQLKRLPDGAVVRVEFRHGLPFLMETAHVIFAEEPAPSG